MLQLASPQIFLLLTAIGGMNVPALAEEPSTRPSTRDLPVLRGWNLRRNGWGRRRGHAPVFSAALDSTAI